MSDIFKSSLHVVNVGLEVFYDDLTEQKVDAVHVAWKAPMISEKAQSLLKALLEDDEED